MHKDPFDQAEAVVPIEIVLSGLPLSDAAYAHTAYESAPTAKPLRRGRMTIELRRALEEDLLSGYGSTDVCLKGDRLH